MNQVSSRHVQCTSSRPGRPTRRLTTTDHGFGSLLCLSASANAWVASVTHFLSSPEACEASALDISLLISIEVFVEVAGSAFTLPLSSCNMLVQRLLSAANTGEAGMAAAMNRPASVVRFMGISLN
ncbi:hypothetical protein EMIT0P291_10042 [Pseudomonas sp. IT-P291]